MPTQVTNYQCPACTGPLHFSAETGKLVCDYCSSAYDVAEIEALYAQKEAEAAGLTSSIAGTQQENDRLQSSIDALDTPEGLEQVARDQLGMVSEGEIVFEDVGD